MKEITFLELLHVILLLGSITYIIGSIIFVCVLNYFRISVRNIMLDVILHFILSFSVTFIFWIFWPTYIDVMCFFILLPAFLAEIFSSLVFLLLFWIKMCKGRLFKL